MSLYGQQNKAVPVRVFSKCLVYLFRYSRYVWGYAVRRSVSFKIQIDYRYVF
jgi:hypothetical protein